MTEACATCGHERTLGRCWRLTCPVNGGTERTLKLARKGPFYLGKREDTLI